MRRAITAQVQDGPEEVDVHAWMGRAALELVGQGGLGHSFDPLTEDVVDSYADAVKSFACVSPVFLPRLPPPRAVC